MKYSVDDKVKFKAEILGTTIEAIGRIKNVKNSYYIIVSGNVTLIVYEDEIIEKIEEEKKKC